MKVSAGSFQDAQALLIGKIMEAVGDGEPYLEFDPPYPKSSSQDEFTKQYFQVAWNGTVEWKVDGLNEAALYSGGICSGCNIGLGKRTRVARVVTTLPRFDISGFYKDRALAQLWSDDACGYIRAAGASHVEMRDVELAPPLLKKTKKRYFELILDASVECVYPADMRVLSGWKCPVCHRRDIRYASKIAGKSSCCLSESVELRLVDAIIKGPWSRIVINGEVRSSMLKNKGLAGLVTEPVAFLRPSDELSKSKLKALALDDIEI